MTLTTGERAAFILGWQHRSAGHPIPKLLRTLSWTRGYMAAGENTHPLSWHLQDQGEPNEPMIPASSTLHVSSLLRGFGRI